VYGVWCMVYGVWCMVYGVWCMVYGVWCMAKYGSKIKKIKKAGQGNLRKRGWDNSILNKNKLVFLMHFLRGDEDIEVEGIVEVVGRGKKVCDCTHITRCEYCGRALCMCGSCGSGMYKLSLRGILGLCLDGIWWGSGESWVSEFCE
jgi:hypothetical protein